MMNTNNRFSVVERERISGHVGGVDFGYNLWVVARSANRALFWNAGTGYWSSVGQPYAYGASHMIGYHRTNDRHTMMPYHTIGKEGGRLNVARISDNKQKILELFGDMNDTDLFHQILAAVRDKQTLLIEGGGEPFTPKPAPVKRHRSRR